jgi:hypothetical protein
MTRGFFLLIIVNHKKNESDSNLPKILNTDNRKYENLSIKHPAIVKTS